MLREVQEHGRRWVVVDVRGIAYDALSGLSEEMAEAMPAQRERAIADVIVAGLKNARIAAELRSEVDSPQRLDVSPLIVPLLRLYLPLKDVTHDFFVTMLGLVFAYEVGAPVEALGAVLVPRSVEILAKRVKQLNGEELKVVRALSSLYHQLGAPVTAAQLSSHFGRDVASDLLYLSERKVVRSIEGGWVIDF